MTQQTISPQELDALLKDKKQKTICVDVRTEVEHNFSRIPGTINIPLDQLHNHIAELKKYDHVILHCATGSRSQFACNVLPGKGCRDVKSLAGGLTAWEAAGLPVERAGKARLPLMRQVFLVAGPMILVGVFLAFVYNNMTYLLLPLLVGTGLTFAGMTGICFMTKILVKMPWNRPVTNKKD